MTISDFGLVDRLFEFVVRSVEDPGTDVMIFKNSFAEKFSEKIAIFDSKQS
jgi:hypothetical protein